MVGHLATGGMAEILLGKLHGPAGFQRPVVLKRVLPHLARREEFRTMFLDEARIVAGIRHPNVVQVHELGIEQDELFLVMEYLEGESVSGMMRRLTHRRESLEFALAAYIGAEACAGLHAAHEYTDDHGVAQNLVHRDISPQNLFVTYSGGVKVLDFGIAKAADRYSNTSTGQMKGKFSYMAPEQCRAEELDRRADLFALGIVLFEISTGRRLFMRDNQLLVLKAICEEPIPRPSELVPGYPPQLEHVVMMALERDRDRRYSSAAEMRRELLAVVRQLDPEGMPEERLSDLMRRIFDDRVREKQEMLKAVRQGSRAIFVPSAEVDSSTGKKSIAPPSSPGTLASMEAPAHRPRRGRKNLILGARAASVVAVLTAVLLATAGGAEGTNDAVRSHAANGAATSRDAPDERPAAGGEQKEAELGGDENDDGPESEEAAAAGSARRAGGAEPPEPVEVEPATVSVRLETMPSGAFVRVGDDTRGRTPLDLTLPRGDEAVEVTLLLSGYEPHTESIVPEVDQRLVLPLRRRIVRRRGGGGDPEPRDTPMETAMDPPDMTGGGMQGGDFFRFD